MYTIKEAKGIQPKTGIYKRNKIFCCQKDNHCCVRSNAYQSSFCSPERLPLPHGSHAYPPTFCGPEISLVLRRFHASQPFCGPEMLPLLRRYPPSHPSYCDPEILPLRRYTSSHPSFCGQKCYLCCVDPLHLSHLFLHKFLHLALWFVRLTSFSCLHSQKARN